MQQFHPEINKVFKPLRKIQCLAAILFLGVIGFKFLIFIEIQRIVDRMSLIDLNQIKVQILKCILLIIMFFLTNCLFQYFYRDLEYNSHYVLIKSLFGISLKKNYRFHEKYVPSAILSMIKEDSKFIAEWKSIGIVTEIGNLVTLAMVFIVMAAYSVLLAAVILLAIIFCFVTTHFVCKIIGEKTYDLQVSNTEVNQRIVDYLNGIKDIKQHVKELFFKNKLAAFIDNDTYKCSKIISKYYSAYVSVFALLTTALPVITILIGVILIANNQFTVGKLIAAYALAGNLQEPVMVIPEYLNKRRQAIAVQNKIIPLLTEQKEAGLNKKAGKLDTYTFQSKEYSFEDGKRILKDICFTIKKGKTLFIRGESGKGKTSLLNLISKFYTTDGQSVEINYNDIPIETIEFSSYYKHVLQAQQTPYIFKDTLFNNIVLGETHVSKELEEVIHTVCLDGFVQSKGLHYMIEQNGENISGGQKQRIGLARALLKKPDILLLDEPTSALDVELVKEITENIVKYCEKYEMSLVIISHNDSFDRFYKERGYAGTEEVRL